MCGIAGIVAADRLNADEKARVVFMRDVLAHRGPDDAGTHVDEHAALGHRRLSIVDLAAGKQPLANEDSTIWITYNGEIYNHAGLRTLLEDAGHCYRTRSDTETIVHAYEQWGDACVERLRGMFAFAIWDAPRRRLLLARDRLGIKPLYWARSGDRLIFASEIKGILESGLVPAELNRSVVGEVLATRYTSDEQTLFKGIYRLLPGHVLVFENGDVQIGSYWDVPSGEPCREPISRLVPRFAALLEESVRLRLMSDVPLGMFLSGGIDSSAIAALMAPMMDRPLQTFSVAFSDRAYSELEYARAVARAIKADSHEIVIDDRDFFSALPNLIWHEDEPIAHPSSVPLYFVSRLARDHVKVVLTGEGSDELLGGYGKYQRSLVNWRAGAVYTTVAPDAFRAWVRDRLVPRVPGRAGRYARRSFLAMPHEPETVFFDNFAGIRGDTLHSLATADAVRGWRPPYAASRAWLDRPAPDTPLLNRILYADIKTYLVELLMKQDQMSMAASIESRVPFLDQNLVEFAATLPPRAKLRGLTTKWILRTAIRDRLPQEILTRRKMGFPVPFGAWMRGAWADVARDVLLDRRSRHRGIVDPAAVTRLIDSHTSGRVQGGDALWALMNLELWARTFIDGDGVQTLPAARLGVPHAARPDIIERRTA